MDFLPDGRMVLTTSGDVSSGGWVPNPDSGEVYILDHVTGATSAAQVTYTKVADKLRNPMGIKVIDGKCYVSERSAADRALGRHQRRRPDGAEAARDVALRRQLPRVRLRPASTTTTTSTSNPSVAINNGGATTDPQPAHDRGHAHQDQPHDVAGLDRRRRPAHAERHRLRPRGRHLRQRQPGRLAAGVQAGPDQAGPLLQPLHQPAPARSTTSRSRSPCCGCRRTRSPTRRRNPVLINDGPFAGQMLWSATSPTAACSAASSRRSTASTRAPSSAHSAAWRPASTARSSAPTARSTSAASARAATGARTASSRFGLQKLTPNGTQRLRHRRRWSSSTAASSSPTRSRVGDAAIARLKDAVQGQAVALRADVAVRRPEGRRGDADRHGRHASPPTSKTVTLHVDGLKPGRVVHVRSPRPFASQHGRGAVEHRGVVHAQHAARATSRRSATGSTSSRTATLHRRREVRHRARRLHRQRLRVRHPDRRGVVREGRRQRGQGGRLPDGAALRQRPEPVPGPEEDDADRQRHEPPDHAAVDRHVEDVGLLPRHGRAQRRREHDRVQVRRRATTATSTSTRCGSPRRARRATRPRRARSPAAPTRRPSTRATAASATSAATRTRARARRAR